MSTIEGGMLCTNNKKIYETLRIIRGHGMLRESKDKILKKKMTQKYKILNKDFLFIYPGYNLRSTEINAVYGLNQIKRLDKNNEKRKKNFYFFLKNLDKDLYYTDFNTKGSCNYAFLIVFKKKYQNFDFRDKFEKILSVNQIEFRRGLAGGGDQTLQPYINYFDKKIKKVGTFETTRSIHNFAYYIGNYPTLKIEKINQICKILNSI